MLLKDKFPIVVSAIKVPYLARVLNKSRNTIYNYFNSDVNELPLNVAIVFSKLNNSLISLSKVESEDIYMG